MHVADDFQMGLGWPRIFWGGDHWHWLLHIHRREPLPVVAGRVFNPDGVGRRARRISGPLEFGFVTIFGRVGGREDGHADTVTAAEGHNLGIRAPARDLPCSYRGLAHLLPVSGADSLRSNQVNMRRISIHSFLANRNMVGRGSVISGTGQGRTKGVKETVPVACSFMPDVLPGNDVVICLPGGLLSQSVALGFH